MKSVAAAIAGYLLLAALSPSAAGETYADGYRDGYKAGLATGGGGGGTQSLDQAITSLGRAGSNVSGGAGRTVPDFWLIPQREVDGQSGTAVTSGAIPFYGKPDLSKKAIWDLILPQAENSAGAPADKLSIYAVPVQPLVSGENNVSGYLFEGGDLDATPSEIDFGNAKATLKRFGAVPVTNDTLSLMSPAN